MAHRVLIDTNLFVSFFLAPVGHTGPITRAVGLVIAASREFRWIMPREQMDGLEPLRFKRKLAGRITDGMWDEFVRGVLQTALVLPRLEGPIPRVCRDPKDDYLIAAAVWADADILISGDKYLLALREHLDRPRIMSPADFVAEFGEPAAL
jgi:putative PIN family toxin of toxin-antitoxin system